MANDNGQFDPFANLRRQEVFDPATGQSFGGALPLNLFRPATEDTPFDPVDIVMRSLVPRNVGDLPGGPSRTRISDEFRFAPNARFVSTGDIDRLFTTDPRTGDVNERVLSIKGGFAPGTLGSSLQELLQNIVRGTGRFGGGGALPSKEDLLDPRLADINEQVQAAQQQILNRFASLGRSSAGSVTQELLNQLALGGTRERQRATGDVDTLLATLGLNQQTQLQNLITTIVQALSGL